MDRRKFLKTSALAMATGATFTKFPFALASTVASTNSSLTTNPFLTGNYAPVLKENMFRRLEVVGSIPLDLSGTYLRNGPNPMYPPSPYVWFDGDGMIHQLSLWRGNAEYINKFIRTEGLNRELAAGRSLYGGFAAGAPFKNAANTSLVNYKGTLLACWEAGLPHRIEETYLETVGTYDFAGQWQGPFSAHPKIDPATGEMIVFGYHYDKPSFNYGVVDGKRVKHKANIKTPFPAMMHDFAITENYSIFLHMPMVFDSSSNFGISYKPELGARIGVVPRYGTEKDIRWFPVSPGWIFHTGNAYENQGKIYLTACRSEAFPTGRPELTEYIIDLSLGEVHQTRIGTQRVEFPQVNPAFVGRCNRYTYLSRYSLYGEGTGIVKFDHQNNKENIYWFSAFHRGGEPQFVARQNARTEDDGWLLCFVHNGINGNSYLLILDAQTMQLQAEVKIPSRVPFGFHGTWIPMKRA